MKYLLSILPLTLVIILAGCTRESVSVRAALDHAERVMEAAPDSALALMDGIDTASLKTDKGRALYALLMTRARYKNYINETDDSLINVAVNYYSGKGDAHEMLSLFQQACITYNNGLFPKAIATATRANELASSLNDELWCARTEDLIADIFESTLNYTESLRHRQSALKHYLKAGEDTNARLTRLEIALEQSAQKDYAEALENFKLVDTVGCPPELKACYLDYVIKIFYALGKYNTAERLRLELEQFDGFHSKSSVYFNTLTMLKLSLGDIKWAKAYCDSTSAYAVTPMDSLTAMVARMNIYRALGDYKNAFLVEEEVMERQNDIVKETISESAMAAQRDYYNIESIKAEKKAEKNRMATIFVVIIAILIITCVIISVQLRMKLRDREFNDTIRRIRDEIKGHDILYNEQSEFMGQLIDRRFGLINRLCDEYFEVENDDMARRRVYKKVKEEVGHICNTENLAELQNIVNRSRDNILERAKSQIPDLTADNLLMLTLIYSGFAPKTICLILNLKMKTFYTRRQRLVNRIKESDDPDRQEFLDLIR